MKNLVDLKSLQVDEIDAILKKAQFFHDNEPIFKFENKLAANLFFEPSTRTQYSFNVAEEKLGLRVISFVAGNSSLQKNESFYDTVKTIDSMGVHLIVIRHPMNEYYNELNGHIKAALINGGDGTGNHPTQSLLDLLTIKQEFGGFKGLNVAIVGDITHSRVAHTNYEVMQRLGINVCTSGPQQFMQQGYNFVPFEQALTQSDVVMMLRIQHERHAEGEQIDTASYNAQYGLNSENIKRMKKGAIIMHPAPVNRGVEIADDVMECSRARIFKQMENGVFVRMAAICRAFEVL